MSQQLKTMNIRGKDYVEVAERLRYLRENHPELRVSTEILKMDDDQVVFRASLYDAEDHLLATGHAHEEKAASRINATSFVENAETSAVGRCLGMWGIGLLGGVASADEVVHAIARQDAPKVEKKTAPQPETNSLEKQVAARFNGALPEVTRYLRKIGWLGDGLGIADLPSDKLKLALERADSLIARARENSVDAKDLKKAVAIATRKAEGAAA